MDKKTIIIIVLSLIIIILIWVIFSRGSKFETIIDEISRQRISALRSSAIIKSENQKIGKELAGVKANNIRSEENYIRSEENNLRLETENREYRNIIDELISGSGELNKGLNEYGDINNDFAGFIRQATITD